ncbi:MAG: hypothetical protein ACTSWW_04320 [Promethearchaeota archaeon]
MVQQPPPNHGSPIAEFCYGSAETLQKKFSYQKMENIFITPRA